MGRYVTEKMDLSQDDKKNHYIGLCFFFYMFFFNFSLEDCSQGSEKKNRKKKHEGDESKILGFLSDRL